MAVGADRTSLLIAEIADSLSPYRNFCCCVGAITIGTLALKCTYRFCRCLYVHFYGSFGTKQRLLKYGKWAVVTGCTNGIGLEFARQLAAFGFDIILIGRRDDALIEVASELEERFGVRTIRVKVDLSQGKHVYAELKEVFRTHSIGILVNSAGLMYECPQYFHNITDDLLWQLCLVNIQAATMITHMVLRLSMISRKSGLILFLSSSACYLPTPQMSAYAATKSLVPSYVATQMTKYSSFLNKPSIWSPSPETYVRHALWTAGMAKQSTGYFPHSFTLWLVSLCPEWVWIRTSQWLMTYFRTHSPLKRE